MKGDTGKRTRRRTEGERAGGATARELVKMPTAVIVNTDSPLGLAVIRNVCRHGFRVVSLAVRGQEETTEGSSGVEQLKYTNPEFRGLISYAYVDEADLADPKKMIGKSDVLADLQTIDLLISLNGTEDTFVKWDLDLVKEWFAEGVITDRSAVIVGRSSDKTVYTTNKALEVYADHLEKMLSGKGVYVSNMIQLGAMAGDEEYVADSLTNEALRKDFRVAKINSVSTLISFLVFYLMPGFLLGFIVDARKWVYSLGKSKDD